MKYNKEKIKRIHFKCVMCFILHGEDDDYGFLSMWYKAPFIINGQEYSCAEQYLMAEKARIFGDEESLKKIMKTKDPARMHAIGEKIKNFEPKMWNAIKGDIAYWANYMKFEQNPIILKHFIMTGRYCLLIDGTSDDTYWGYGLDEDERDPNWPFVERWQGENVLGFTLMEVRDALYKKYPDIYAYYNDVD